jgi:predicted dehydrogenase
VRPALERIGAAVVGYGYWGPNLVRNICERPEFRLRALCEVDRVRAAEFVRLHPGVPVEPSFDALLEDPSISALCIATPPRTHYELARRALDAGKHVLVEKPLATDPDEARDLIHLAEEQDLVLMPGHTFVYSPPVNKVRELIQEGVIGDVYFVTSSRMNLGVYQSDGVVFDLAPHDLSILLYWLGEPALQIAASGQSILREQITETAFLTVTFPSGTTANIQLSWLAPRKMRQMVVVGSKRMVQYEDTASDESVRVYDRGLEVTEPTNFGEYQLTYRTGDMVAPRIDASEPLSLELEDFAAAIKDGRELRSNPQLGLEIVLALAAAEESLRRQGEPVTVRDGCAGARNGNGKVAPEWALRRPA